MAVYCCCIIEHSHIMNKPRPTSKNKCKPHVEVITSHDILCTNVLAAQVVHKLVTWHHTWNMSPIYTSYAVLEEEIEPRASQSIMHSCELWVHWLNVVSSKLDHTLQNFVKQVGNNP